MDNKKLLEQISTLIDQKLEPIKTQLDTVEMKVELVNKRIDISQEETIDTLSELITSSYEMNAKRIKALEDHLQNLHTQ